jgi:cellulose synthase/poly-beta-1,6-N-acetylglucosamine synthase-like glycosyltransferase
MHIFLIIIFWVCLFLVFYTYIGYGLLMWFLVRLKEHFSKVSPIAQLKDERFPELTLFITAYNEEDIVDEKMKNSYAIDYPKEKMIIFWVIDGSTDGTREKLQAYQNVTVLHESARRGKTASINRGMQYVKTPIVVFSDANSLVSVYALKIIAGLFADTTIGCVSGEKRIAVEAEDDVSSKGESVYWKYESFLKSLDSRFYSAVGAAGELFAIRKDLFEPMPEDTLLDDFILSMRIAQKGYRIAYTADAYAIERGSLNMEEEAKRKKRIAAGGWQSIIRLTSLLNIFRYGRLSFQYISHRVLRWSIAPFALLVLIPLNLYLALPGCQKAWLYSLFLILQVVFYAAALIGYRFHQNGIKSKLFYIPYYFVFMNLNVFFGIFYLLNNKGKGIWEKTKRR